MPSVSPLSASTIVARGQGLVDAEVDREVVALSIEKGTCYGLDLIGSHIWRLLAAPIRIGDLCATLQQEYDVEPDVCQRDVIDLLEELRTEGMIESRGDAGSADAPATGAVE